MALDLHVCSGQGDVLKAVIMQVGIETLQVNFPLVILVLLKPVHPVEQHKVIVRSALEVAWAARLGVLPYGIIVHSRHLGLPSSHGLSK